MHVIVINIVYVLNLFSYFLYCQGVCPYFLWMFSEIGYPEFYCIF